MGWPQDGAKITARGVWGTGRLAASAGMVLRRKNMRHSGLHGGLAPAKNGCGVRTKLGLARVWHQKVRKSGGPDLRVRRRQVFVACRLWGGRGSGRVPAGC